jgi:hypothetical protein
VYGMKIESILNRPRSSVSVDHLSRVLVDIFEDSTKIISDLLSAYQASLLNLVFRGDEGK